MEQLQEYDYSKLGGWCLAKETVDWIDKNIKHGSTILELGSGEASYQLSKRYKIYSVEHDPSYLNIHENVNYVYAPLFKTEFSKFCWYNYKNIKIAVEGFGIKQSLLIIDGPIGHDRLNYLCYMKKCGISLDCYIIVDDTNREADNLLAQTLACMLYRKTEKIFTSCGKSFTVIHY